MERRDRGRFIRGLVAVGDFCCINLVFLMVYLFFDSDMTPSIQPEDSLAFTEYIIFPGSVDV